MFSRSLLRRRRFYGLLALFGLALYYFRIHGGAPLPVPGYESYFTEEVEDALDAGRRDDVKYVHFKVKSHQRADEALANLYLYAHLAYASNRAYVFDPLEPVSSSQGRAWWSRTRVVPLTAWIDTRTNRSVEDPKLKPMSFLGWHGACPRRARTVVQVTAQNIDDANYNPNTLMDTWSTKLQSLDSRCVEVVGELFTDRVLAYPLIQPLFDAISASPVVQHYMFSESVISAASAIIPSSSITSTAPTANNTVVLLAYLPGSSSIDPCETLSALGSPFRTFAHLHDLPTAFDPPAAPSYYEQRCNPSISELIGRLGAVRSAFPAQSGPGSRLKHIYIIDGPIGLTPEQWAARKRWFEELKYELGEKHGWESVRWAKAGAKPEAVAIDMEVAARAEAFMGNGFSDFASNVVLLRTARGKHKGSIRFV